MKPIYLKMTAFGSYGQEEEIDFSDMDHGIFLITGDTGAGKTTIFDAITYALYDKTSGGRRDGEMMRSQFAPDTLKTSVELQFLYNGEKYSIKRSPKQERLSKRKNAEGKYTIIVEQPSVELLLPNGKEFRGKIRETNRKIEEIVGLDVNQFTQIAMIAQGDFLKLLQASSKERKEIFQKIFDTRIYWMMEQELDNRRKAIWVELADNQKTIEREIAGVSLLTDSLYEQDWKELCSFTEMKSTKLLEVLDRILAEEKAKETEIAEKLKKSTEEIQRLVSQIEEMKRTNDAFAMLAQDKAIWQELEAQKAGIKKLEMELEKGRKALHVLHKETLFLGKQKEREDCKERILEMKAWMEKEEIQVRELEKTMQGYLKACEEHMAELTYQIRERREALPKYQELDMLQKKTKQLGEMANAFKNQDANKKQELQQKLETCALLEKEQEASYQRLFEEFVEGQVSILQSRLTEGEPCPVCGSRTHHLPDKPAEHGIVQKQNAEREWEAAKKAEQRMESARKLQEKNRRKLEKLKQEINADREELDKNREKILEIQIEYEKALARTEELGKRLLFGSIAEAKEKLRTLEKEQEELARERQAKERTWKQRQKELQEKRGEYHQRLEQECRLGTEVDNTRTEYRVELTKQGFQTEDEYHAHLKEERKLQDIQKQCEKYKNEVSVCRERIRMLEIQTKGKVIMDPRILQESYEQKRAEKAVIEKQDREIYSMISRNEAIYVNIKREYETRKNTEEQYNVLKRLSDTANGKLYGSHINFQTFIQRKYFRKIIYAANRRLRVMTKDQFILQCKELERISGAGEAGIYLDVYSALTDKTRDVKTLSGGESFMASLAMALGMSDIIQQTAGRINIDTMFIDEGFGTLSDEARNEAINILRELSGDKRLIGIISHVAELKNQLDRKLVVTKTGKGSKVRWE